MGKDRFCLKKLTSGVSAAELALGGVAVAEAGRAAELVFRIDVEVSGFAPVAPLAFHVLLAIAVTGGVVTTRSVLQAALGQATAGLATQRTEVPVVDLALLSNIVGGLKYFFYLYFLLMLIEIGTII